MQKENTVTEQKTEQKRYATLIRIAVISEGASRDEVLDRLGTWAEGLVVEEVDNGDKGAVIDLHTTEVKEGESDSDVFSSYIGFPTLRSGRRE